MNFRVDSLSLTVASPIVKEQDQQKDAEAHKSPKGYHLMSHTKLDKRVQRSLTNPNFRRHPRARTKSEKAEENDMVTSTVKLRFFRETPGGKFVRIS